MKLDSINSSTGSVSSDTKTRAPRASSSQTAEISTQKEVTSFSDRLQQLGQFAAQTPAVDSKRVAEIKQAIAEGRFQVNPEKIADGLIESVRQMVTAQTRPK